MLAKQHALNNVTMLHQDTVFGHIKIYLQNHAKKSKSTANAYERDIRLFFRVVRDKDIEDLSRLDIQVNLPTLMSYQTFLQDIRRDDDNHIGQSGGEGSKKYKNQSINRMIASISSLYDYLKACEYDVNPFIFKEVTKLSDDTVNIGFLSSDEAKILASLAVFEKHKGFEKEALILLAASTSIRKDAILNIKYSHIKPHETISNCYVIESDELFDKGKMIRDKEIHEDLYQKLIALKKDSDYDGKIFSIKYNSLDDMMKRLCTKAGFDSRRNVSFHSLKKAGIDLAHELGGLYAAQMQGGHASSDTTAKYYLKKEKNISGMAMFENISDDICDDMSREELLQLVKMQKNGAWMQTKRNAVDIKNKRFK